MSRLLVVLAALAACQQDSGLNRIVVAPDVAITTPAPNALYRQGDGPQPFNGEVVDEYDGPEDLLVEWVLDETEPVLGDLDEEGRVSLQLDVDAFELGEHRIELRATDSDGEVGRAAILWTLWGPLSAPDVTITAPDDGSLFSPGEEITFRGTATDASTPDDQLTFAWTSDRQGPLSGDISGNGESVLFTSDLEDGTHLITLSVTDLDGETGQDSIEVRIGDVIEPAEPGDLVFSEMMINPSIVADEVGEWVELYNTASYAIDIGGYTFHDKDYDMYILEGPLVVAGKDYIVLCADMSRSRNGGVPCDGPFKRETSDALALGNNTDEVILSRPDGVVIDEVYYNRDWYTIGVATGLDPNFLESDENDKSDKWCDQSTIISSGGEPGTPGRENDPC